MRCSCAMLTFLDLSGPFFPATCSSKRQMKSTSPQPWQPSPPLCPPGYQWTFRSLSPSWFNKLFLVRFLPSRRRFLFLKLGFSASDSRAEVVPFLFFFQSFFPHSSPICGSILHRLSIVFSFFEYRFFFSVLRDEKFFFFFPP